MKPRYSFSSRRTRHLKNIRKQRAKYPKLIRDIVNASDIILEILDARFPNETQNFELEKQIKEKGKRIIYVLNKSDLIEKKSDRPSVVSRKKKTTLNPHIFTSCKLRRGIKGLRDLIKKISKEVEKSKDDKKQVQQALASFSSGGRVISRDYLLQTPSASVGGRVGNPSEVGSRMGLTTVGIIGYPNTGKSSLINLLIGRKSAATGAEAGFTKGVQKLRLTPQITLLDTPGVIPESEYSGIKKDAIARHTIVGGRSYSQVKNPELVVANLMKKFRGTLERHYKIKAKANPEILLEKLGKKWNYLKKGGVVNEDKTARRILKEWQEGLIKI